MKPKLVLPASLALIAMAAVSLLAQGLGSKPAKDISFLGWPMTDERLRDGQQVYTANCASCHGANLEGQPDWKRRLENGRMPAPPHDETGHTWHHSDRNLFIITKSGLAAIVPGYESDMPAFKELLTDSEIVAVLAYIKSTWPEPQRNYQAEISANDKGKL